MMLELKIRHKGQDKYFYGRDIEVVAWNGSRSGVDTSESFLLGNNYFLWKVYEIYIFQAFYSMID